MISFKKFLLESNESDIQYAIEGKDDVFINKLVDSLSFIYKKRIEKYIRPMKIVGIMNDEIELRIHMTNKDIILFNYKNTELKISINGEVVYHMDEIGKTDIINIIEKYYKKYLEKQFYFIVNKNNPF